MSEPNPVASAPSPQLSPTQQATQRLHIDFAIPEESPIDEPPALTKLAFGLAFLPLIGFIGLGIALYQIWQAHHNKAHVPGLAYGAIALQVFYTLLLITALTITAQVQQSSLPIVRTEELLGQRFLQAVKQGDSEGAEKLIAVNEQVAASASLAGYQGSIGATPLLIANQKLASTQFVQPAFIRYNGLAVSYQLWRVGGRERSIKYITLLLAQVPTVDWKVIQIQGLETSGDVSALSVTQRSFNELTVLPTTPTK